MTFPISTKYFLFLLFWLSHYIAASEYANIDKLTAQWIQDIQNEGNVQSPNSSGETLALVQTKNGTIMGSTTQSVSGHTIYQYLGIPFAQPPVGSLRFKPPQPYQGWGDDIYNATRHPHSCMQFLTNVTVADEDCLYLSVYSRLPGGGVGNGTLLPVIYYIYGGAFVLGQNSYYDSTKLLEQEIVLVTTQYRIGPFGFLSTGDDTVSANNGLRDQIQGLRWVQENIERFGGDPNRVTISGTSAGAMCALYLLLSPPAHGLFHGVIAMSGSALMEFSIDRQPVDSSKRLGRLMNCSTESSQELIDCLMEKDGMGIAQASWGLLLEDFTQFKIMLSGATPVVEGPIPGAVVPEDPLKLLKEGYIPDVPVLLGTMNHEGILPLSAAHYLVMNPTGLLNDSTYVREKLFTDILTTWEVDESRNGASVSQALAAGYLKPGADKGNFTQIQYELLDVMTVLFMKAAVKRTADILSRRISNVYLYNFEYYNQYGTSIYDWVFGLLTALFGGEKPPIKPGICHGDDLLYMFRLPLLMGPKDTQFSRAYCELFTNFVIHGNPTPEATDEFPIWPGYNTTDEYYMRLDLPFRVDKDVTNSWKPGMPGIQ